MGGKSESRKTYRASSDYIHRKISDTEVLISVGANIADFNGYIEINESAAVLWNRLQEPCEMQDLVTLLEERYQISTELARQDVLEFLQLLEDHHMVVIQ